MPLFVLLAVLASLGPSLLFASLNVKYRDFRYVIPFIVQFGLYISPVGFSSGVVPKDWRLLYSLNPMVGVIDGFRWAILGGNSRIDWPGFSLSVGVTALLLWLGISRFRRTEKTFADLVCRMTDIVVKAEHLGKRYVIGHQSDDQQAYGTLRDTLTQGALAACRTDVARGNAIIPEGPARTSGRCRM